MELGVQYVISLKIICCSKRQKDLLLRNKFGETVFFFGGGEGVEIFWQTYLYFFISNPLSNCARLWGVA